MGNQVEALKLCPLGGFPLTTDFQSRPDGAAVPPRCVISLRPRTELTHVQPEQVTEHLHAFNTELLKVLCWPILC